MRRIILIIFFSVSTISFSQEKIQTEKGLKSDFIYKSGNIGIGITNPKSFLHINGWSGSRGISLDLNTSPNGSNSPNIIWDARNGGASYFFTARQEHNRLDFSRYKDFWSGHLDILSLQGSNGFIGIGTSSPQNPLHITSNTSHHQLKLQGINGKHSWLQFYPDGDNFLDWQIGANGNGFGIYDITNSKYRFIISNSGNIGIGITNPKSFLHVNGWSGSRGLTLDLNNTPNGSNSPNIIWDARNGGASYFFTARQEHNRLDFSRYKDFWSGHIDILSLQGSNGFVGIGTSNPDSKLTVAGKIHSREVLVTLNAGDGADFVFENDYNLPSLKK